VHDRRTPPSDPPANRRLPGESTLPTGGSNRIHEIPAPVNPPPPPAEEGVVSKRTREVTANKPAPGTAGGLATGAFHPKRLQPRFGRRVLRTGRIRAAA
jgi:hypothetical protein